MRQRKVLTLLIVLAGVSAGCTTVGRALSPFPPPRCDKAVEGKCQSVETTYQQSVAKTEGKDAGNMTAPATGLAKKERGWWTFDSGEAIKPSPAVSKPLVLQGEVLRWHFAPYRTQSGLLVGAHDVFSIASQPEFTIGIQTDK